MYESDVTGHVIAVHAAADYQFSKNTVPSIELVAGLGVVGDAHFGSTVQHRSRIARDAAQPNMRQVHLLMSELLDEVNDDGHDVQPGQLGENITTAGIDLIGLPVGTVLRIGSDALVAVTGLRNPCKQIEGFGTGLLKKMFIDGPGGRKIGRTGVMSVVIAGGVVHAGDAIQARFPAGVHTALEKI